LRALERAEIEGTKGTGYKKYLLALLLLILAFNFVDRLALGISLQGIKADLALSDTQLGLLSGIAFALFYSVGGIPIARWADRGDRVVIISLTVAIWSVLVALCGAAQSFLQLMLVRVGVGIGEAGCIPPATSLIADHFTRTERPRATAVYMLGGPLSVVFGYFLAGWLNQIFGWRLMFAILGLPGLALSLLAWVTLKEPRHGNRNDDFEGASLAGRQHDDRSPQPTLRIVFRTLWSNITFRHLLFCFSIISFFGYGILQWQPAFFIRSYGMTTGELGSWFAVIYGLGGILGTYLGGEISSRYAASNESLQLKWAAGAYVGFGAVSAFIYLAPNHYLAFGLMGVTALGGATVNGPLYATIQTLVPPQMRAVAMAVIFLFSNLIGMGLGPLVTGVLSDVLQRFVHAESLRYSLLALCPGYVWGGWHVWQASRTIYRDMETGKSASAFLGRNATKYSETLQ